MKLPLNDHSKPRWHAVLLFVLSISLYSQDPALSQGRHSDVMVTVMKYKIVALSAGGSGGKNHSE